MAKAKEQPEEVKLEAVVETPATEEITTEVADAEETTKTGAAKAGKRSPKALKEAEEKAEKEARKASGEDSEAVHKPAPKTRSRLERRGKNFRKVAELIQKDSEHSLADALELAQKTNPVKFDAAVEIHINLNVDPRHADQNVRDNLVLPHGTGKKVRVAVFADTDDAAAGKKAGADIVGSDDFLAQLDKQIIDFDILVATPAMMPKLGKYARLLGPKGLMPNPKSGTVTTNVAKAVAEAKAGRVEYRVDSTGIIHSAVGKLSFGQDKLLENTRAFLASVKAAKPASVKATYIKSIYITTSMGPSIKLSVNDL